VLAIVERQGQGRIDQPRSHPCRHASFPGRAGRSQVHSAVAKTVDGPADAEQLSYRHCHINRKRSRLNEARWLKDDHAAFRAYVSSCQTSKIKEHIIR
jgi:hypothetical protein